MKNKIYDCFMFNNESDLLEIRFNILNNYVDYFVIIESSETHTGLKKKLVFDIKNYPEFKDKIIYGVIKKFPYNLTVWQKENYQRNYISKFLDRANSQDFIMISDLDEIPNPNKIREFNPKKKFAFFEQKFFSYKFNVINETSPKWYGSRICVKKQLKSPQWLRNIKIKKENFINRYLFNLNYQIINNGGWHFCNLKTPAELVKKISSFCHGEFNKDEFKDEKLILEKIEKLEDIFDRSIKYKKISIDNSFPQYLVLNEKNYLNWIL